MSESTPIPSTTDRHVPTSEDFNGLERSDPDLIQAQMNIQAMWIIAGICTWFLFLVGGLIWNVVN